jgi:hypothetical protein
MRLNEACNMYVMLRSPELLALASPGFRHAEAWMQ